MSKETGKRKSDWYSFIEKPIRRLVRILRRNGFNTTCSCGHLPEPYIQMEWYADDEVSKLYDLLIKNGYKDFSVEARWFYTGVNQEKTLTIIFHPRLPLIRESQIRGKPVETTVVVNRNV